jgi:hypothetical protein
VKNPDGTTSTVRSLGVNIDGKEVLIPTVVGDRVVSDNEAIAAYKKTGQHLGIFKDAKSATTYAEQLHRDQAAQIEKPQSLKFSMTDIDQPKPKGDTYKGPSTWAEGFSESVKDTVAGTAKSFLGNAAAIVNPMTYVRGYEAKKADEARMMKELETGVVDLPDDYGAGKVRADLASLTTPEGGGAALANLVAAGVLPRVPVAGVSRSVVAAAKKAAPLAKNVLPALAKHGSTVVGAYVGGPSGAVVGASVGEQLAARLRAAKAPQAIANPAPAAAAKAAPVAAKAAPLAAEVVPILDEAGRPLGGTTVPEATVGAQKPKYAGPERRLTPDEQVRQDLRSDPSAGRKADAERFKVNAARAEAEAARAEKAAAVEKAADFKAQAEAMKARFEVAKAAKAEAAKTAKSGKAVDASRATQTVQEIATDMRRAYGSKEAARRLGISQESLRELAPGPSRIPLTSETAMADAAIAARMPLPASQVMQSLNLAAKRAKITLSPSDYKALTKAVNKGVTPAEAVTMLLQQRLAS